MTQLRLNEGISALRPGVEAMADQRLTIAPVVSPLSEDQGNENGELNDLASCPSEDLSWIEDYALECNAAISPSGAQLVTFHGVLVRATSRVRNRDSTELVELCNLLPRAINRTGFYEETYAQCYVFEVLCEFVEFAVATFSQIQDIPIASHGAVNERGGVPGDFSTGPGIPKLVEALAIALDSECEYYKLRMNSGMREDIPISLWRLSSVLKAPGFVARAYCVVSLDIRGHLKRVNALQYESEEQGSRSEDICEADAVLVYLMWMVAKTACGSGYEHILKMLGFARRFTLPTVALLVRPLCQLMSFTTCYGSNAWTNCILRDILGGTHFKTSIETACCLNETVWLSE